MYGTAAELFKNISATKDAVWADQSLTLIRRDAVSLVSQVRIRENKRFLDSMQPMEDVMSQFKDKKFKDSLAFDPLGILEPFKNTLIEDILKNPPKAELKATDPTAITDRKKDIQLLKNRKIIEGDISKYQQQIGLPTYKYDYKNFKGNVEDFDKEGLDENDPEDITLYEKELQRLNYEIAGQSVLDNVMKLCRFDQDIAMKVVRDILAAKALSLQMYVDKITGELKVKHIFTETFYGIFGDSGDGRNDIAKGWVDNISINEWIQLVGNEFDWDRDWRKILWAINFCGNTKYTGFIRNNTRYECCGNDEWMKEGGLKYGTQSNLMEWTIAYNYQISAGYYEWKVLEATSTYVTHPDRPGYAFDAAPYNIELSEKQVLDGYQKESKYQQQTYGSYFIATSSTTQWIFGFGKVYYQTLEGANDEYSSGTLHYYLLEGRSAVEIAKPYIRVANKCFYKMLWCIDKAKPEADTYVYEELVQIAKGMQRAVPQTANNKAPKLDSVLRDVIQFMRDNIVNIRAYPQVEGRPVLQLPSLEGKRNGIDPVAAAMQATLMWARQMIAADIGVNPMRVGASPPPRESEKSEMNTVEFSVNATSYIYRMFQNIKEKTSTTVLNITQNIIRFKDSIPYKWLLTVMGNETFDGLFYLDDYAAHRMGLFVRDYNSHFDKQKVIQAADMALNKGELEFDQWVAVTQVEDFKMAAKMLSLYKRKRAKKERLQKLQEMKVAQDTQKQAHDQEMERINAKGQWDFKKAEKETEGFKYAADAGAQSRIKVKEITVEAEGDKQQAKAMGSQEVNTSKQKDKEQQPFAKA
jgi:hypothetical protein